MLGKWWGCFIFTFSACVPRVAIMRCLYCLYIVFLFGMLGVGNWESSFSVKGVSNMLCISSSADFCLSLFLLLAFHLPASCACFHGTYTICQLPDLSFHCPLPNWNMIFSCFSFWLMFFSYYVYDLFIFSQILGSRETLLVSFLCFL